MKTLNKLLWSGNTSNNEPIINIRSGKLIKTVVAILLFTFIILLLPSCIVGLQTRGNNRRTGSTTERHDGNGRDHHDNDDHHENDKNHDHDEHQRQ